MKSENVLNIEAKTGRVATARARTMVKNLLLATVVLAAGWSITAVAQDYPNKAIRLIVPYPPGGATDVIGRIVAQKLSGALGQSVIVENRAGAAGSIGAAQVASAPADGYTLLLGAMTSHAINEALRPDLNFTMEKSFSPIAIVGNVPLVFVVSPKLKVSTLGEFILLAKAKPSALTFGSAGTGSPQHLAGEMFQRLVGVKMLHVPYKGSGPALTDLLSGQLDSIVETVPAAQGFIKAGKLQALAVATAQRVEALPNVPTAAEAGVKGFEVSSMFGIAAPANTAAPTIAKISAALKTIMATAEVKNSLLAQGAIATYTTPAEAGIAVQAESAKWKKVIKDGNIKVD